MRYIEILESLFIVFRVTPFSRNIARSLLKEPKMYFYDNGMVLGDDGARLENFVAVSLFKHVIETQDLLGKDAALHYIRTREGKEVDFCIAKDGNPERIIEAKSSETAIDKNLRYFNNKYGLPAFQVVKTLRQDRKEDGVKVVQLEPFLSSLM
ncbi:MAG: hypothetical protein A2268_12780 [Candidatus Raymondbacteria bacterium RifOxyA12_full_50_37]|uniref:DUF4143 domain-containing protein n=1 Tax=Candidatus Raymondbacteria bacterium RIFOXYD12_FULL_49_13 TaxID=1817890 RepID=A0A1F7F3M1_UNCRA|nr:MAG: hypothetical protein A2268_12780 [Candidatus Raymondbacteria bacterium RifOxyA12_full_50_37]OGJ90789.1 MAG: hypothetical protein A2248_02210 [Candidatus Raymondbacteria bacterium RIFOXYA2_FULL_49_16]OGJ96322.1 MAG: hypothetical protein A2350_03690 [Candidatus Raymondbacteria bacterium RifOxyB12_full_50_8]OGJ96966.1 MAG: hypothetical protein A2487_06045 [Candidatus Raymondbacteria bacterium RifOxyC12_full_50_8]OGJ97356.1 MAG: hypothetical protein A2453_03490 [Candidatus Raymondbacteria b